MYNVVNTLAPSFLIRSFLFLQVRTTTIMSRKSSNFSLIRPRIAEITALERLENIPIDLLWGKSC